MKIMAKEIVKYRIMKIENEGSVTVESCVGEYDNEEDLLYTYELLRNEYDRQEMIDRIHRSLYVTEILHLVIEEENGVV